ncbi:hypothetical protein AB0H34_38545 [Saccharopolyspora shandongensis]|uniref:hypothetical protein n=1 Tax=Saccharopolyspora shandongensis TaxID=418495 RepID=UPI00340C5135
MIDKSPYRSLNVAQSPFDAAAITLATASLSALTAISGNRLRRVRSVIPVSSTNSARPIPESLNFLPTTGSPSTIPRYVSDKSPYRSLNVAQSPSDAAAITLATASLSALTAISGNRLRIVCSVLPVSSTNSARPIPESLNFLPTTGSPSTIPRYVFDKSPYRSLNVAQSPSDAAAITSATAALSAISGNRLWIVRSVLPVSSTNSARPIPESLNFLPTTGSPSTTPRYVFDKSPYRSLNVAQSPSDAAAITLATASLSVLTAISGNRLRMVGSLIPVRSTNSARLIPDSLSPLTTRESLSTTPRCTFDKPLYRSLNVAQSPAKAAATNGATFVNRTVCSGARAVDDCGSPDGSTCSTFASSRPGKASACGSFPYSSNVENTASPVSLASRTRFADSSGPSNDAGLLTPPDVSSPPRPSGRKSPEADQ